MSISIRRHESDEFVGFFWPKVYIHTGLYSNEAAKAIEALFEDLCLIEVGATEIWGYCARDATGECCVSYSGAMKDDELPANLKLKLMNVAGIPNLYLRKYYRTTSVEDILDVVRIFLGIEIDEERLKRLEGRPWNPLKAEAVRTLVEEYDDVFKLGEFMKPGGIEKAAALKNKIEEIVDKM